MSDSKKKKDDQLPAADKPKLHTDFPLSEKDEVKQAEHKTAKSAAKNSASTPDKPDEHMED